MINQTTSKCNILGVNVEVTSLEKTLGIISDNLESLRGKYICISNVHTTVMSYDDKSYRHIQNSGYMALPDGKPLSVVSRFMGHNNAERVTGPDLMEQVFNVSEINNYRHYFYGSTPETLASLENELKEHYPNLGIAGMYSPPFRKLTIEEDDQILMNINDSAPDFIWVGLGAPKQEVWMYNHMNKVHGLMVGVGAGFDFFAKNIKRAPKWMQRYSMEWLYRLIQDPGRLWKRYLVYNTRFILLTIKQLLLNKR